MEFKILSHACLMVKHEGSSVIIDPWLVGSCYWRSWWNFPQAVFDPSELACVDAVIISHLHWDHWHGPTLRRFFKGKRVIVPDEPGLRSERDLRSIGFKDVVRVRHGEKFRIGSIDVTMYQFGRYLNDAAIVVEAGGFVLLNANDAKIAGASLNQVIKRHRKVDFAFRSHSSANPRVCFKVVGDDEFKMDDREHYFRSFVSFMDVVQPRFAIPFASNHCHLNDDVLGLNSYISNPLELRDYCNRLEARREWRLQVMLPGSRWSAVQEFALRPEGDFADVAASLSIYRESMRTTLSRYREVEQKVEVSDDLVNRFLKLFEVKLRPRKCRGAFVLAASWPDGRRRSFICDLDVMTVRSVAIDIHPSPGLPVFEIPAVVFRDSIRQNMFHHAGISKRCRFLSADKADLARLEAIFSFLESRELGLYPLSWRYLARLLGAYRRRWRELVVYAHALWLLTFRKKPMYLVEESILRGEL